MRVDIASANNCFLLQPLFVLIILNRQTGMWGERRVIMAEKERKHVIKCRKKG